MHLGCGHGQLRSRSICQCRLTSYNLDDVDLELSILSGDRIRLVPLLNDRMRIGLYLHPMFNVQHI